MDKVYMNSKRILLSTSTFWFWKYPYEPQFAIDQIKSYDIDIDGIDIWLFPGEKTLNISFKKSTKDFLKKFKYNTIHTDFYDFDWLGDVDFGEFANRLYILKQSCLYLDIDIVVIHADFLIKNADRILRILDRCLDGIRISFEFMDKDKLFGNHPSQFRNLFMKNKKFGFVPDIAHLQDFQSDFSWREIFHDPVLKDQITLVHMSNHSRNLKSNYYSGIGFENIDAVHSLCISDTSLISEDLLDECRQYAMVIEGIVPPGQIGINFLNKEINWLRGSSYRKD